MRAAVGSLFMLACALSGFAQRRTPGGDSAPGMNSPLDPRVQDVTRSVYVTGRVSGEGGVELPEPAEIRASCGGQRRTQVYTDWKGGFSFPLGSASQLDNGASVADASVSGLSASGTLAEWRSCQLEVVLAGFAPRTVDLNASQERGQSIDLGVILLHPLGNGSGFTISATSAAAPDSAKKAFSKGLEQKRKQKWTEAERAFESAVKIYPAFAVAWFELGTIQLQQNKLDAARASFQSSAQADSKFVSPYRGLAELAMHDHNWNEVVDSTNKIVALDPVSFANAWLYNGIGNYNLGNLDGAEKSARKAVVLDKDHRLPKSEYLLGMILIEKKAYKEATEHMQQYQHFSTDPKDVAEAQQQLKRLAALEGASQSEQPSNTPQ